MPWFLNHGIYNINTDSSQPNSPMDNFYPAASNFRAIFNTALKFYQAGQYDAALVSFNEVCNLHIDIFHQINNFNFRPCSVLIQLTLISSMIHELQFSPNLDKIKRLWKMQEPPFVSPPIDGRVTHAQRVYFSNATKSTRQCLW